MRIEIPLYEGFDEVDAIAPFEVLANAATVIEDLEVELVGAHGPGEIVASHGARILTERGLSGDADLVLVPGGGWRTGSRGAVGRHMAAEGGPPSDLASLGVRREYDEGVLPERLRELHAGGAAMASVCTGTMLLAKAGITDGRPATTHRGAFGDLRDSGAELDETARVVDDGDLLTCGGVTSGLDLAFHLVRREWGDRLADKIAELMEHAPVGPVRVVSADG